MAAPAQPVASPVAIAQPMPWSLPLRLLFRFLFCYCLLYDAPSLLGALPGTSWITGPYRHMWTAIHTWIAVHLFHLAGERTTRFPTGSGDTTLDYISLLCNVALSFALMLVWSALDRRRRQYKGLHEWLRILVRYTLAVTMLGYGFAKIFPLQFRTPALSRLIQPYGEFSPMGALWWFMGASTPYIIFTGSIETLGGLLLFMRRTTTLGAMICLVAMTNVAALNYSYDVPVKLYSTNLALMSVLLLAPDLRRLSALLIQHRPEPLFQTGKLRILATVVPILFVSYILFDEIKGGWQAYQSRLHAPKSPLYGVYDVEAFTRNGKEIGIDKTRWRKVVLEFPTVMTVRTLDDTVKPYGVKYDTANHTLALTPEGTLAYARPDPDHLTLSGKLNRDEVSITLKRIDPKSFLLLNRGYHWINERPLNR